MFNKHTITESHFVQSNHSSALEKITNSSALSQEIAATALDFAILNSLLIRWDGKLTSAPVSILPSAFDKNKFNQACDVQRVLNKIILGLNCLDSRVFRNIIVDDVLGDLKENDHLVGKLVEVFEEKYGGNGPSFEDYGTFGVIRSDFMVDQESDKLSMIEFNTIASGLLHHGKKMIEFHKVMKQVVENKTGLNLDYELPEFDLSDNIVRTFCEAYSLYPETKHSKSPSIIFIDEDPNPLTPIGNLDQRGLELELRKKLPKTDILRFSISELSNNCSVSIDPTGHLIVDGLEIAVVYFRSGFDISHYVNEKCWEIRKLIENSRVIKCPDIKTHLLTCKLVQTELHKSTDGLIYKNLSLPSDEVDQFMATGVEQLELTPSFRTALLKSEKGFGEMNLENFVLKEMDEGGFSQVISGSSEIMDILRKSEDAASLKHFLLMKKVKPEAKETFKISEETVSNGVNRVQLTQELGIFGCFVLDGKRVEKKSFDGNIENSRFENKDVGKLVVAEKTSGYIVRSKYADAVYGSFSKGTAALDSIFLV